MKKNSCIVAVMSLLFAVAVFFTTVETTQAQMKYPNGAIWKREVILFETAPQGFKTAVAWWQVATGSPENGGNAEVSFDYVRLIEKDANGKERIIAEEDFDSNAPSLNPKNGGLFTRQPNWFADNNSLPVKNSVIENGSLTLDAAKTPNHIIHGWTDRAKIKPNAHYYAEARIKIKGQACVQLGLDYWKDFSSNWNGYNEKCEGVNNCAAWISDWYCAADDWEVVRAPVQ